MWFERLTGFKEISGEQVRANIVIEGSTLRSLVNGKCFRCGNLEVPSLDALRNKIPDLENYKDKLRLQEVIGDVQTYHKKKENSGAFFQAASQFNLLEMVNPEVTPERGVGIYELDRTQGPACAIACGAGTIFRNYFAPVNGLIGQTANNQIDCLRDMGTEFQNEEQNLWTMKNGYAFAEKNGLLNLSHQLKQKDKGAYEKLKGKLRIGIQWDTEVTISEDRHRVSQAYCSALPIGYSSVDPAYWEDFAILVLEASYEASFYAALINYNNTGNNKVFLTLLGGGVFGNKPIWIMDAIRKAIHKFENTPLSIHFVSYSGPDPMLRALINDFEC